MKLLTSLLFCVLVAIARAQPSGAPTSTALAVDKTTGAITGPVSAATFRTGNGLLSSAEIIAGYQPKDSTLTAWGNITFAADTLAYGTGVDTFSTTILTSFGRSLIDDANAAVARTTIGLGNVDNTTDAGKPVSTAQAAAIAVVQADVDAHEADTANPHGVTKTQVGLGNADNTSDANKPVSTAQAAADAVVLASAATDATTKANAAQAAAIAAAATDATTKANAAQAAAIAAAATDATTKANAAQAAAIAASQPLDAGLTSISGLTTAANKGIYTTALDTYATYDLTAAGRALAGVAGTANTFPYFSASNVASLASVTAAGLAILDDADATAQRATLGLSSMALQAATSVAITGGTINGTTIGASTPSSGAFTTGSFSSNLLVGGYGSFGNAADTGDARKVLAIGSSSTTDTIFEIRNTSTGGGTWQLRTGGQSGSSGLAVNEFGIYSGTYAGYPLKFAPATGLATFAGDITSTITGLTGTRTFFLSRDASNGAKFAYDNANNRTVITNMWDDGAGEAFRLVTRGAGTPVTALSITGAGAATFIGAVNAGGDITATSSTSAYIRASNQGNTSPVITINSNLQSNFRSINFTYGASATSLWKVGYMGSTTDTQLNFESQIGTVFQLTQAGALSLSAGLTATIGTFSGDVAVNGGDITSTGSLTFTTASNGNVVVAPNGTGWLEVPQRIYRTSGDIQLGPTSGSLTFYTGGSERGRFNAAGELLLGTAADAGTYALQVTGNQYVSGAVQAGTASAGDLATRVDRDGLTRVMSTNGHAGTTANARVSADNTAYTTAIEMPGNSFTTSGPRVANRGYVYSDGSAGMTVHAVNGSLRFWTGNTGTERMVIGQTTGDVTVATGQLTIATTATPASASATGTTGTLNWDTNYIYVATGTNTWKRAALSTW